MGHPKKLILHQIQWRTFHGSSASLVKEELIKSVLFSVIRS